MEGKWTHLKGAANSRRRRSSCGAASNTGVVIRARKTISRCRFSWQADNVGATAAAVGSHVSRMKCSELQRYIQPLSSILRGLRSGRYSERERDVCPVQHGGETRAEESNDTEPEDANHETTTSYNTRLMSNNIKI
ncbi:hypothetical protein GBF38_006504 [Nibea albiflora]|uniref:Uncharacterized protein n=1 Tax=Nibea albiflora TaxID=240163 RepID=A0ACB7EGU4_NIBAL|nr:hypothetical protein GBF38_006504 [Nibea albiflora]